MFERFDQEARNAVSTAHDEAYRLGHPHVGTEHLLLGLAAQTGTAASDALISAGASLVSIREKVVEALASRTTNPPSRVAEDLPFTDRASRSLDRAGKMSLRMGSEHVHCEHILLSVLAVEGTAGQVLRGLWVDPEAVRRALDSSKIAPSGEDSVTSAVPARVRRPDPRCGTCGALLASSLDRMTLPVGSAQPVAQVSVIYCTACGTAIGVDRA
jgi:ATP-dependent Clp protease ATP-binding subunit ClpA